MSVRLHCKHTKSMFDLIAVECGVNTEGFVELWPLQGFSAQVSASAGCHMLTLASHAKWNVKLAHLYTRLSHLRLIGLDTATLPPVRLLFFLTYPSVTFHLTSCFSLFSQGGSFFTFHIENIILLKAKGGVVEYNYTGLASNYVNNINVVLDFAFNMAWQLFPHPAMFQNVTVLFGAGLYVLFIQLQSVCETILKTIIFLDWWCHWHRNYTL